MIENVGKEIKGSKAMSGLEGRDKELVQGGEVYHGLRFKTVRWIDHASMIVREDQKGEGCSTMGGRKCLACGPGRFP